MITNTKIRELKYSIHLGELTVKGLEKDLIEYRAVLERLNNELQAELAAAGSASERGASHGRYAGALVVAS